MNQINIIGNVATEPVIRTVQTSRGDTSIATFSVAVNDYYQGKDQVTFFRINLWGNLGERASKIIKVGTLVFVTGKVKASAYSDKNSELRASLEVNGRDFSILRWPPRDNAQNQRTEETPRKENFVDLNDNMFKNKKTDDVTFHDTVFGNTPKNNDNISPSGASKYHEKNKNNQINSNVRREDIKIDDGDDYE